MQKKLSELEYGESGLIEEILASRNELACLGVRARRRVRMITHQPLKGPVVVEVDDMEVAIGLDLAEGVVISPSDEGGQS